MPLFGKIIVIKRNGTDGTHFPLTTNSCLFGRKRECDIRIQLPQVSKEHCKIEVNENKEATLFNLSSANPTELNGSIFQHPTYLKHGDVLTVIDRSFRFEYPPLLLPQKRLSRSQEKEKLQVLQQVEQEELLHCWNSEYKSPQIPEKKLEWESQNTNRSDKRKSQKYITGQCSTPESTYKTRRSERKNEMSPFSKLYELVKHEGDTKNTEEDVCKETFIQSEEHSSRKDNNILLEAASQIPHRTSETGETKKTETLILKKISDNIKDQEINCMVSDPISVEGNICRRSSSDLQDYATEQKQESEDTNELDLQDAQENKLENTEVIKNASIDPVLTGSRQSAKYVPESCCIVSLEYTDTARHPKKSEEHPTETADVEIKADLTDTFGSVESVLPKSNRESFQAYSSPCSRKSRRSSSKSAVQQVEVDSLIELKSSTENSAEIEECSMHVSTREHESDVLIENKYFKIKGKNKVLVTEPIQTPIETNEICANYTEKDEDSGTTACSLHRCKSKSTRRSNKQDKDFSNGNSYTEEMHISSEESAAPVDHSGTHQMQTTTQLPEENVEGNWLQEEVDEIKWPATNDQNILGLSNLSESGHESSVPLPAESETTSELNRTSPLHVKRKSEKKSPQKSKDRELDLLIQPPGKRKRVSFGGHLSPELFDKHLPPNSPLKRGATPARLSLPFGNSPRAVLKKALGFRLSLIKSFPERKQHENISASPPPHRSPAASPPAQFSTNISQRRGCFSVSHITSPTCSGEQDATSSQMHGDKEFTEVKTPEQESKAACSVRRSKKTTPRRSSLYRRSGAMGAIHSKRRSGASEANLIVAKSWADVVKQGVPKSQLTTTAKSGLKRSTKKIHTKRPSKSNASILKTPTRKVKGHFTTGHANSPAPIVIGKAHTSIVNVAVQVPKVMFNYPLKQHGDLNESFTGLAEMFNTPLNGKQKSSLSPVQKTCMPTPEEVSEMHTPEEYGEMSVSPFKISSQQKLYNQDVASPFLREASQIVTLEQDNLKMTPRGVNSALEESVRKNMSLVTAVDEASVLEVEDKRKSQKQKLEPVEPLSGVKRLLRTPKQKPEPVEALLGIKRLLKTPKQKQEPVEALAGVNRLLRTPKQKQEPVEALSGVKRVLRTPKQKQEPIEALSGVKRLLRTPKQKQEPVEALSGVKRLLRTPKQKQEPVEALSEVKQFLRTPKQNLEPFADDIVCSKFMNSPEEISEELMGSITKKKQKERMVPREDTDIIKAPKERVKPVEDMGGIQRLLRTPKQKFEPVEDMVGISQLFKTPKQKFVPVDDYLGLQKLMTEPKQNCLSPEVDYTGVKEMLETAGEQKAELAEFVPFLEEDNVSYMNSRGELESMRNDYETKEAKLESSAERESPSLVPRENNKNVSALEGQIVCNTFNALKSEADITTVEFMCVPESNQSNEMDPQDGDKISANPGAIDTEMVEPLTSARRTRRGKANKSSSIKECDTKNTQRCTRSTQRAKSPNYVQANGNFDQNIAEKCPRQKSESNTSAVEIETKMVADKRNEQAEASLDLEENVATQENGSRLITKKSLRSKNGKNNNDLKSKLTKIKTQDTIGNQDLETSGVESIGNGILKRNRRGKSTSVQTEIVSLNTAVNDATYGSLKCTTKTYKMEIVEDIPKENAIRRGKGRKVQFLLENDSVLLEEKCVLGDKDSEEQKNVFLESSTSCAKENTSRKSNRKSASQPVCMSLSKGKHILEICEDKHMQGDFYFEKITLAKEDPSVGSSNFIQEKCVEKMQNGKNPNEAQKVPLESVQTLAKYSPPRRQTVAKGNPPRRGRSKQAISHEIATECDSKQAADIKDQDTVVTITENQSKRGRGRRIVPVCQMPSPLESITLVHEGPTVDSVSSAQEKWSLQEIQNEENTNEAQKVPFTSVQTPIMHSPPRRQSVAKGNPPRKGRSKRAISHKTATECDSKQAANIKDQDTVVTVTENQSKRGRGRRIVPVCQMPSPLESITLAHEDPTMDSVSSVQGKCSLQEMQNEENTNKAQKISLESVQTPIEHTFSTRQKVAKGDPPRRGRRKQAISHETSAERDGKQAANIKEQDTVVTIEGNNSKRGRGRKIAPICQIPSPLENIDLTKEGPTNDNCSSVQQKCYLQEIQIEENPNKTHNMTLESMQPLLQHSTAKRQKMTKENPCRRGRKKQVISHETPTECDGKQAADAEDQDMLVTVKESQSKRGRGRKIAPVFQTVLSSHKNDILPSSKAKSAVGQPNEALEIASEKLLRRGRRRKTDEIIAGSLVSANKKPRLLNNGNQEKMPEDLQSLTKENVSKRGRRKQLVSSEISIESNGQLGDDSKKATLVKDNMMPLENCSLFQNQSKSNREKRVVLASQMHPFKVSINMPPSPSDKGEPGNGNQNALVENDIIEKGILEKHGRRNKNKIVAPSISIKRKHKLAEEDDFQEKQNVDIEKAAKCSRRDRKVGALEATISASLKEKHRLNAGGDTAKDQQVILNNTVSEKKGASKGREQKFPKGKSVPKSADHAVTSNNDQNCDLELSTQLAQKYSTKQGRRKQINCVSEANTTTSDMKNLIPGNKSTKPKAENAESVTLQKGKRGKRKEEHSKATVEPVTETEGKTRASRRTKK
ncbi:proliferation marker protein Ki-67 isoform X2 [Rhineura floridana]|uniref:proliferation marker protein Ki-67 isoform X2 n=1 Tax=Rhineura floridana TaxID=261503 RepID=UPI002AC890A0|nr:proliferation marker protein Ki-67 isoform X2 [Rhineura floridana]